MFTTHFDKRSTILYNNLLKMQFIVVRICWSRTYSCRMWTGRTSQSCGGLMRRYSVLADVSQKQCCKIRILCEIDCERHLGPDSIYSCHLTGIGNPIVEIRRSYDRLISTMGFPIPVRCHLYIESGPWSRLRRCLSPVHKFDRCLSQ